MLTKAELRREALARLRGISPAEREAAAAEIARRAWQLPEISGAGCLLLYASLPEEAATDGIAREALRRGIALAYPRTGPDGRMELHRVPDPEQLRMGRWRIREPDPEIHPELSFGAVDVALVPGLAWDRTGARLGRGGGFYDRLLGAPGWTGFVCGLFFALQEVSAVPTEPWDRPLDAVVTERECWRPDRTAVLPTP